ncbi:MAG: Hsp70 family protein [Burkholderiaceae bacterium]
MPSNARPVLGIDFGTSNSAVAAVAPGGAATLLPLEGEAFALPSAIFFNAEEKSLHFGRDAVKLYLAGVDGRLMRSLKSLLGSSLLQEHTAIPGGSISFQDVIALFLKELRLRSERHLGHECPRAVLGRPVHFVDDSPERDALAQASLEKAARAAGFSEVAFELEPIAAAFDYERRVARESLVLIVDIGGGTSDFTVVRVGPERMARKRRTDDVLATSGVHIGGTDYDQKLNSEQVMPLFGFRHTGPHGREVPSPIFLDLATWHMINRMYAPRVLAEAQSLRKDYTDPRLHDRLMTVMRERLGHHIAGEVEAAKIRSSTSGEGTAIDLTYVERDLEASLAGADLARHLGIYLGKVVDCAHECVRRAQLRPDQLDAVYLTGGSSALRPFQALLRESFPGVPVVEGDLFGGVASGLGYVAGRALD